MHRGPVTQNPNYGGRFEVVIKDPKIIKWMKRGWITGVSLGSRYDPVTGTMDQHGMSFVYKLPLWYRLYLTVRRWLSKRRSAH